MTETRFITVDHHTLRRQIRAVFDAWGMPPHQSEPTVEVMVETDLRGIDSHGVAMLGSYDKLYRAGRLNVNPVRRALRENAVTALIDADAGIGHPVSVHAMNLAADKALASGVAVVTVRNSHHFGAAGIYAEIAARRGCVGLVTSTTRTVAMVPTRGADSVLGTNPIAFAAPARRNAAFLLDMATSTSAMGKLRVRAHRNRPLPAGWIVDAQGRPITDAAAAMKLLFEGDGRGGLTPLGGSYESGSHKGYGLAVMVQILSGALAGGSFSPVRNRTQAPDAPDNIAHFFLAIDPRAFREDGEFEADTDRIMDVLHATRPANAQEPVLVAGEVEYAERARRLAGGIPLPPALIELVRGVAERAKVPFLLD